MKRLSIIALASAALCGSANAQSSSTCSWVGNVWTCNHSAPQSGVDWGAANRAGNSYNDSFQRGLVIGEQLRRNREERERQRLEQQRLELERQMLEQRRVESQALRQMQPAPSPNSTPPASLTNDQFQAWLSKARPHMGRYPDFEKVVFDNGVNITPEMVVLMSGSDYAADVAYYLATHRAEATAISRLPTLEAGRALDQIEARIRAAEQPAK